MPSYGLGGNQLSALYGLRRRRVPYDAFIESQIPSLYLRKREQENKQLAESQLALDTEALDLSERELEENKRQAAEELALKKEQMDQAAKDAKTGQAIQIGQTGILGGYVANKAGLGKKLFGLGKQPTDATSNVPVGETATGILGQVPAAVDMGVELGPELLGETLSYTPELAYPTTGALATEKATTGLTTASKAGPAAALAAWAWFVGGGGKPIMDPVTKAVGGVLGMGKTTAPSIGEYINAYLKGAPAGTDMGYGQTLPAEDHPFWSDYNLGQSLVSGAGTIDPKLLNMIRSRDLQGLESAGLWNSKLGQFGGDLNKYITRPDYYYDSAA